MLLKFDRISKEAFKKVKPLEKPRKDSGSKGGRNKSSILMNDFTEKYPLLHKQPKIRVGDKFHVSPLLTC